MPEIRFAAPRTIAARILALAASFILSGVALPAHCLQSQRSSSGPRSSSAGHPFDQDAVAIFALLNRQAADWNRGDLESFATGYKNSPDILFIGSKVEHGYDGMLAGYKAHYPTRQSMGTLTFTQLNAQRLDARFATATGHFHLERTPEGGGAADGFFLLVLEKTPAGWKIVRDDTTSLYPRVPVP